MAAIPIEISLPLTTDMLQSLNSFGLIANLGITLTGFDGGMNGYFEISRSHQAPNGYLHAGLIFSLADTLCGIGCQLSLPEGAKSFTTMETKINFFATAKMGRVSGTAQMIHGGRTTQVWDCRVISEVTKKVLAEFRCTQLVLYPDFSTASLVP